MPLPANTSSGRALLTRPANILAQIRTLALGLSASARWWLGDEATLTAWVDRIGGVSAAAGGSGLAFGALGGRRAIAFGGAGYYTSAAFAAGAVAQPHTLIVVAQSNLSAPSGSMHMVDGRDTSNRAAIYQAVTTGRVGYNAGAGVTSGTAMGTSPAVVRATFHSPSGSELRLNGTQISTADSGANAWAGINIGVDRALNSPTMWQGTIATILSLPGVTAGNATAAQIETLLRAYYGF